MGTLLARVGALLGSEAPNLETVREVLRASWVLMAGASSAGRAELAEIGGLLSTRMAAAVRGRFAGGR